MTRFKIVFTNAVCGAALVLAAAGAPTEASEEKATGNVFWTAELSKEKVFPGEPVLLIVKAENRGNSSAILDFGMHGVQAFFVRIRNATGEVVATSQPYSRVEGIDFGYKSKETVPPGETCTRELVLNRFCSTRLPVGRYHVTCFIELAPQWTGVRREKIDESTADVTLTVPLEIIETDEEEFARILSALAQKPFTSDRHRLAKEMLSFTESPLAIEYQVELVKRFGNLYYLGDNVIFTLERSGSEESIDALRTIAGDESISATFRRKAARAIEDLSAGGDSGPCTEP